MSEDDLERMAAETRRLNLEADRLLAEERKLNAEELLRQAKIPFWVRLAGPFLAAAAVIGAAVAAVKTFFP